MECLCEGALASTFTVGRIYQRKKIHDEYGGQRYGGISTPALSPFIFIFSGKEGRKYGYNDEWKDDGSFRFFGHGQVGDMNLNRGNAALRNHIANGRDVHLFQKVRSGYYRYGGQMVCLDVGTESESDMKGTVRKALVFHLVPVGGTEPDKAESKENSPVDESGREVPLSWYWKAPLDEVMNAARNVPSRTLDPRKATRNLYHRSEAVKVYVQRRAKGNCEGCGQPAPFKTKDGRPYLEPHHTRRLSDGGPDDPKWVVAVCPTCHRRAHYASDGREYNEKLKNIANNAEEYHSAERMA